MLPNLKPFENMTDFGAFQILDFQIKDVQLGEL